jgi:deoxycytidylate deaminase
VVQISRSMLRVLNRMERSAVEAVYDADQYVNLHPCSIRVNLLICLHLIIVENIVYLQDHLEHPESSWSWLWKTLGVSFASFPDAREA